MKSGVQFHVVEQTSVGENYQTHDHYHIVWILGMHQIGCGQAREEQTSEKMLQICGEEDKPMHIE